MTEPTDGTLMWSRPRLVNLTSADSSDGGPVNDKTEFMTFNDSLAPS